MIESTSPDTTTLPPENTVSPALEKRAIQNEGGFLTPYYLFDLMERKHAEELDPLGREAYRLPLKRVFLHAQKIITGLAGTPISSERTWTLWYKELFSMLGFTQMQRLAESVETARYGLVPISHACYLDRNTDEDPLIFIDLHPFGTNLDHARYLNPERNHDLTTEPISRALEFALDHHQTRWALLSNGLEMRLYRRGGSVARQYLKVDFVTLFAQEDAKDWLVFWGLFRLAAFLPSLTDETTDSSGTLRCLLDKVIDESQRHATKIADDLRDNIVRAVENLLQGVIETPENRRFWNGVFNGKKVPDETQLKTLFDESVYFLYRLLFVLYAESRDLLPIGESSIYKEAYSLDHLREMAEKPLRTEDYERTYYIETLRTLFKMLYRGYPFRNPAVSTDKGPSRAKGSTAFRIPPYNGRLFDPERTTLLDQCQIPDRAMREVVRELSLSHPKRRGDRPERYSYADLGVDQLGSVYEGLLVYEPSIAEQTMVEAHLKGEIRLIPQDQADELELRYDEETRKPAGSFLLRIWGGRRKGSGSYYTPQEITAFLVKEALAPLVEPIIVGCAQRDEDGKPIGRADEILQIKVCDPAMGSGAFLVQACRYLGEAYGRAIIAEEQRENTRIGTLELARYKRRVAEKCLYGVDLNPLAVELAKVSLWLETLSQDRPLTFLDAHLRYGNSLISAPVRNAKGIFDPFSISILPIEAIGRFSKDIPEKTRKFLDKLKAENKKQVQQLQAGQLTIFTDEEERKALASYEFQRLQMEEADDDKNIEEAVALVHHKQDLLQSALLGDGSEIRKFKDLCDLWCAVWFWPLDIAIPPPTTMLYRDLANVILKRPNSYTPHNTKEYLDLAKQIAQEQRFFHWELEFPEVWCDEGGNIRLNGGFDVIVGNPPWDKIKPNEREFYSNYNPTVWSYQGAARKQFIAQLREDPDIVLGWNQYERRFNTLLAILFNGNQYQHQTAFIDGELTGGDPDTFKFFTERAYHMLHPGGKAAIIVPHGIQASEGCTGLRRLLLDECNLQILCRLDNEKRIFSGVFHGQKFDLLVFAKGESTEIIDAAFFNWEKASVVNYFHIHPRHVKIDANLLRKLTPDQYTFIDFHDRGEVELIRRIFTTTPNLNKYLKDTWNVAFISGIHLTSESYLFYEGSRLETFGATKQRGRTWHTPSSEWYETQEFQYVDGERIVDSKGNFHFPNVLDKKKAKHRLDGYLLANEADRRQAQPVRSDTVYYPLYEGRMVHQFDHTAKAYVQGSGRSAKWRMLNFAQKEIIPHYFVAQQDFSDYGFRAGFCDVTGPGNERSLLAAIIPAMFPCGNTVSTVLITPEDTQFHLLWVAIANSFIIDWLIRLRVSNHVNFFLMGTIPFHRPDIASLEAQSLIQYTIQLTCITPEFAPLWLEVVGEPWQETSGMRDMQGRAQLRAQIDAIVADLYEIDEFDFAYILNTFPLLDRDQPPLPGEERSFVTRDMALLALFTRRGKTPPSDIISFFSEAGVDIRQRTGAIIDLAERVRIATQELGAVAYQPSRRDKEENNGDEERTEQDELDFYDEE